MIDLGKTPSGRDRTKIKTYNDQRTISEIGTCSACGSNGVKIWLQSRRRCVPCHRAWKRIKKGLPAIAPNPLESDIINFWKRTIKTDDPVDCWVWTGSKMEDGYPRMFSRHFQQDHLRAHRFAFFLKHGRFPIPNGLHRCDNPSCVNPDHIFEGTNADNVRDCVAKGRFRNGATYGSANHKSKLNAEKVIEIRERYAKGEGLSTLGRSFAVSPQSIFAVVTRKSWGHVSELKRDGRIVKAGTGKTKSGCSCALYQIVR